MASRALASPTQGPGQSQQSSQSPSREEIARKAYEIWLVEGRPNGRAAEHWRLAEKALREPEQQQQQGQKQQPKRSMASTQF